MLFSTIFYAGNLFEFKFPQGFQKSPRITSNNNGEELPVPNERVNENSPGMIGLILPLVLCFYIYKFPT
jgi:hypothetical protein